MPTLLRGVVVGAALVAGASSLTHADVHGFIVTVSATAEDGHTATWQGQYLDWTGDGSWSWQSSAPFELRASDNTLVATCHDMRVGFVGDPVINQFFAVQAAGLPTNFLIQTAVLNFPVGTYTTSGSAQMGVTDTGNDGAGVFGLLAGNNAFGWLCNGGYIGLGIQPFAAGPGGSNNGGAVIPNNVYPGAFSMQSEFFFSLTANDIATGSSHYEKVPAPAAASLLGLGGLLAARRRR